MSERPSSSARKTSGWVFEPTHPMGGPTGTAYTNTLQGTGDPSARLVREVIQNSTDAQVGKVVVRFRHRRLRDAERAAFLEASEILKSFQPRHDRLGFDAANVVADASAKKELSVLFIEDYHTTGLRGELTDSGSDFHRLLLSIGDDQKAVDEKVTSGGSYGYGKAVLSSSSRIRTIFAYSLAQEEGKAPTAKLLGCAYGSKHDDKATSKSYTGRAWLGAAQGEGGVVHPFVGDAAHEMARVLGFAPRGSGDFGTSILIVDCSVQIADLRRETETYWWPRLIDDELEVEFSDDGAPLPAPRPKSRPDLRPYIACYDMAVGRAQPVDKHQSCSRLNRTAGKELGWCAFEVLTPENDEDEDSRGELRNQIAVLRRPKMVVTYLKGYARSHPEIAGVFVADDGVDNYLKMSEPPDHTAWEASSGRLAKMKDQALAVECIKAIHSRVRNRAREFQAIAMPPPAKQGARLTRLERALGSFFRTLGGTSGDTKTDPVAVRFVAPPRAEEADAKRKKIVGEFEVRLKSDHAEEKVEATIEFEVPILWQGRPMDPLPLQLVDDHAGSKHSFESGRATLTKTLKRNEPYRFQFSTDAYDKQWSAEPVVKVAVGQEAVS